MGTNSKKTNSSLTIFRDAGYGWSTSWTGSDKELPDSGAEVRFTYYNFWHDDEVVSIDFGYVSPSGKDYKRNLSINLIQTIELRDFLNEVINKIAMSDKYFYFISYGSNMLLNRIKNRIPNVEVISNLKLSGYKLLFNKKSKDGSTKANIKKSYDENDVVWTVLHRIKLEEKEILDKYEGLGNGYNLKEFSIKIDDETVKAYAYVCDEYSFIEEGKPYDWYLQYLINGAVENEFPKEYIDFLKSFESEIDLDIKRREKNQNKL
ncbi:gamma-glutamylcyclotransferase family protein [Fulvivirgaceae bacterium LMO-SS25]